jgi:hypothetical protein
MGGLFSMVPVLLRTAPDVATAFARGGGVKFEAFGSEALVGLDLMNRGQYEQRLTSYWLEALPDVAARLQPVAARSTWVAVPAAYAWRSPRIFLRRESSASIRTSNRFARRKPPLFADCGYQGPEFSTALAKVRPHLNVEIVKRSDQAKGFVVLPKRRAHACLAQSLPKARQGLGEPQSKGARVPATRLNSAHASKTL